MSRRLLLAAGGGGSFVLPSYDVFGLTSPNEGGWVWFGSPRAIRNGDATIFGYVRDTGDVRAALIDNDTRTVTSTTTLYDNFLDDDHEPPSFVVRPDGVILAAFAYHLGELYVGTGTSPGVLPAQADVTNITSQAGGPVNPGVYGYTYASIHYIPDEDRYYIFVRYHNATADAKMVYTYSDDDGATWATHVVVADYTYHMIAANGTDRLDFTLSDHPDHGECDDGVTHTSIYHAYFTGGAWFKTDGSSLSLPISCSGAALVYDGTTSRGWIWDIAIGSDNRPRIVFVTYDEPYATGPWTYRWARWTGSAWDDHEVADAGTTIVTSGVEHYAGGIVLDHEDPNVVYYSSNAGGPFQVYRAVTADNGATWAPTAITADSDKNVRPLPVVGHDGRVAALFLFGTYTDYFDYQQGVRGIGVTP